MPRTITDAFYSFRIWLIQQRGIRAESATIYASNARRLMAMLIENEIDPRDRDGVNQTIKANFEKYRASGVRVAWNAFTDYVQETSTTGATLPRLSGSVAVAQPPQDVIRAADELIHLLGSDVFWALTWRVIVPSKVGFPSVKIIVEKLKGGEIHMMAPLAPVEAIRSWSQPTSPKAPFLARSAGSMEPFPRALFLRLRRELNHIEGSDAGRKVREAAALLEQEEATKAALPIPQPAPEPPIYKPSFKEDPENDPIYLAGKADVERSLRALEARNVRRREAGLPDEQPDADARFWLEKLGEVGMTIDAPMPNPPPVSPSQWAEA